MIEPGAHVVFRPESSDSVVFEVVDVHRERCSLRDPLGHVTDAVFPTTMLARTERPLTQSKAVS